MRQLAINMLEDTSRNTQSPGLRQALKASRNIHAIAIEITAFHHHALPHPALGQDFTPLLSRVTPSAVSEPSSELIGCPISRSLTASCVCLELRSLPSTGVTRPQRYCEPLRHPRAPGLSLAGVRLVIPDHALGLPVLPALSLCTCCRQYPGVAAGRTLR